MLLIRTFSEFQRFRFEINLELQLKLQKTTKLRKFYIVQSRKTTVKENKQMTFYLNASHYSKWSEWSKVQLVQLLGSMQQKLYHFLRFYIVTVPVAGANNET